MTHLPGLEIGLILHERTAVQIKSGIYRLRERGEAVCLSRKNLHDFSFTFTLSKSHQFSSVAQSCLTLCDPMDCSMPGLPVHQELPEFTQTHVHWFGDAIQPSYSLLPLSPPGFNFSQHQGLFQSVSSLHTSIWSFLNRYLKYLYSDLLTFAYNTHLLGASMGGPTYDKFMWKRTVKQGFRTQGAP